MKTVRVLNAASAPNTIKDDVREILLEVDEEFVPPLSWRTDRFPSLQSRMGERSITPYFKAISKGKWVLAFEGDKVVGLLSLFTNLNNPILNSFAPHAYVSTLAVRLHARRDGVATSLYSSAFNLAVASEFKFVTTRSWNQNYLHAGLMRHLGFQEVARVHNDRGPEIDTVYFARPVTQAD